MDIKEFTKEFLSIYDLPPDYLKGYTSNTNRKKRRLIGMYFFLAYEVYQFKIIDILNITNRCEFVSFHNFLNLFYENLKTNDLLILEFELLKASKKLKYIPSKKKEGIYLPLYEISDNYIEFDYHKLRRLVKQKYIRVKLENGEKLYNDYDVSQYFNLEAPKLIPKGYIEFRYMPDNLRFEFKNRIGLKPQLIKAFQI